MAKLKSPVIENRRSWIIGFLLLGIVGGQLILYGASFAGSKILLPLEILTRPRTYIPLQLGQYANEPPVQGGNISDPVFEDEPARLFRHSELVAGRLPTWNPYQYAGVPSVSFLSPFAIFAALVRSPRILPWLSLLIAAVSGTGMYCYARAVLGVSFWPATIAAWCYPVSGFFVFWQSTSLSHPVVWLPWLFYAVHQVISASSKWAMVCLALTTMLTLISGHLDMAGLVLLAGGLFALWQFFALRRDQSSHGPPWTQLLLVVAGWGLGFMLASSELLGAIEYAETGSRINERGSGREERPPIGLQSLPQLLTPHIYGSSGDKNSFAMLPEGERNLVESPATGFAGLIMTLFAAPLAWGNRRHRSAIAFLAILALIGMAWCLDLPGLTALMRLPLLNMISFNRFVFVTAFAVIALGALGLEELSQKQMRWHSCYYVPAAILAAMAGWFVYRIFYPPEMLAVILPQAIAAGQPMQWVQDQEGVARVQNWFTRVYFSSGVVCLIALGCWAYVRLTKSVSRHAPILLGMLALAELLFFGYGLAAQSDPSLYYPSLPALEALAHAPPGRVVTHKCFPANLLQVNGFSDIRGYDGVDPVRYVELVDLAAAPENPTLDYAALQYFIPQVADGANPGTVRLSPILDLLGVRYIIIPDQADTRYYILPNESALPRVFVPRSVEVIADPARRLAALAEPTFNPRTVAYVEQAIDLPAMSEGEAAIADFTSQRIVVDAKMKTPGLVVLADQWNKGWRAYLNDVAVPVLRVDHALRGVAAPAGESRIVFKYQPSSMRIGFVATVLALMILAADIFRRHRAGSEDAA